MTARGRESALRRPDGAARRPYPDFDYEQEQELPGAALGVMVFY
jgi:hypothetical protein